MDMPEQRIDSLDTSIFEATLSQTSQGDRRSLLAVQRAIASKYNAFTYLEIGSFLGGSIQPYLLDPRCRKIYSIDPRPERLADDRSPGYVAHYENNSSSRMLELLEATGYGNIDKIECIEQDASRIDLSLIASVPEVAFIDGEHTRNAVRSDFSFCERVISKTGVIVFHDFLIVYPTIIEICNYLKEKKRLFVPLKLEDNVFAIFFDRTTVMADPYLKSLYARNRCYLSRFVLKQRLFRMVPKEVLAGLRRIRGFLRCATGTAVTESRVP